MFRVTVVGREQPGGLGVALEFEPPEGQLVAGQEVLQLMEGADEW